VRGIVDSKPIVAGARVYRMSSRLRRGFSDGEINLRDHLLLQRNNYVSNSHEKRKERQGVMTNASKQGIPLELASTQGDRVGHFR